MKIILGSTSPRRQVILENLFGSITIMPPSIKEVYRSTETPAEFAARMSEDKCLAILSAGLTEEPGLLITADTIVSIDNAILGKPLDFDDAVRIISLLNGKTHEVITGLTLLSSDRGRVSKGPITRCAVTEVTFKKLSREDIISYLGKIEFRDKAGSYAIQEHGEMIIEKYQGSATNIIGFPLGLFFTMVRELGLTEELFH